jgi:gliding motility-associated-like protein
VSARLTVSTAPTGTASFYEANVCEDAPLQLNAAGGPRFSWFPRKPIFSNDTISNPIVTLKDSTLLTCVVYSVPGCDDTVRIKVNVWKNPIADAGPDRRVKLGSSVQIMGKSEGTDIKSYWTPGSYLDNTNSLTAVSTPPVDMIYQLHVESDHGCKAAIDEVKVRVFDKLIVPNTFTPNGDGVNDYWEIRDLDVFTDAIIEVYNTAGQRVYRSVGYDKPWDGTMNGRPLPVGTYYYAINLKEPKNKPMVGYITILR